MRAKEGRGQISALGSSIHDFCFPDPKMQFEPIKSMVQRGLSPIGAGRGRKRSLKLVTQSPCHALPNFATIGASTRQTRSKRCMTSIARLGSSHFTGDTDQVGTIDAVRNKLGKRVCVFNPHESFSVNLKTAASYYQNIPRDLPAQCQLPDVIPYGRRGDRFIHRPPAWR